jgi:hypothetical protein
MNKILFKLIEGKGKFFLMRGYIEPSQFLHSSREGYSEHNRAMKPVIDEALKSGEIVNPELLIESGFCKIDTDGIYFSVNDGVAHDFRGFEEFKHRPGNKWIEAVRLLPEKPEQKEESQESLWASIINDARWYDGSPQDLIKLTIFFKSKFDTIKRKKS